MAGTQAQQNHPPSHPVRLPASATLTLPRWGLWLLCLLYILPGLIGRDPWKSADAASFGVMWTMAHGGLYDWLWPNIVGLPMPEAGPLTYWLGAICIKLLGGLLGDPLAARIAPLGFFLIGVYSIWHAAYLLGRHPEAQPMRLAFGGQPAPNDYGRVMADGALLIYLGFLGLLMNSHETSVEALVVALVALSTYLCVRYAENNRLRNACLLGLTLGCLTLTNGWVTPLALLLAFFIALYFLGMINSRTAMHLLAACAIAFLIVAIVFGIIICVQPYGSSPFPEWLQWNYTQFGLPSFSSIHYFARYGIWFFWPAWPFAIWAIYAWRKQWRTLHILLPLSLAGVFTLFGFLNPDISEITLLPLLPALAIMAAFGLPTMKRNAINAIDWFSVMTLTTCAILIWFFWIVKHTGWPEKTAKNIFRQIPGFVPEINLIATLVAVLATIAWIALVYWRVSRRPSVLWRAVVLSSGGVILCWLLLATIWLPAINYMKSYAGVAQDLAKNMPNAYTCVDTSIGQAQRTSFAYFGRIQFSGFTNPNKNCEYVLIQTRVPKNSTVAAPQKLDNMNLVWEGRRASDRQERFRLYQRETK